MGDLDWTGRRLPGGYLLGQQTGKEALGCVYDAERLDGARFRVKVLSNPRAAARKRFERELRATSELVHPNILPLVESGEFDGRPYMVLEYLDGPTLARLIEAKQQLDAELVAHILEQVLEALGAAHAAGVLHRNVTPDSVLIDPRVDPPGVRLGDFGLALLEHINNSGELTADNYRLGKLAYMAPEYINDSLCGPRSDLYALGVLVYEMLTGEPPPVVLYPIPAPSTAADGVPGWLDDLVARLAEPDPEQRLQTVAETRAWLQQVRPH